MALLELRDLTITIAGTRERTSSRLETAGGHVLVIATTLPDRALAITSCYLSRDDGDVSATHLRLAPDGSEQHTYSRLPAQHLTSTHAARCLLDHATHLNEALTELTSEPVAIDVGLDALDHAPDAWGPPNPHG